MLYRKGTKPTGEFLRIRDSPYLRMQKSIAYSLRQLSNRKSNVWNHPETQNKSYKPSYDTNLHLEKVIIRDETYYTETLNNLLIVNCNRRCINKYFIDAFSLL